jgi:TetR/AcrR family transcriptional regulator
MPRTRSNKNSSAARPATPRRRRGIGRPPAGTAHAVGRETLIAKACELLTRLPPSQVTRAEVARSTGVDPSLIRYYFRDRATLMLAAVERLTAEFVHNIEDDASLRGNGSPRDQLRARVLSLFRLTYAYPYFHQLIVDEIANMNVPAARKLLQNLSDSGLRSYANIMEAGAQDGSLRRVDNAFLFISIIGMTHFFTTGAAVVKTTIGKREYNDALAEQYGDFICDLLLNGLHAKP